MKTLSVICLTLFPALSLIAQSQGTWNLHEIVMPQSVDIIWNEGRPDGISHGDNFDLSHLTLQIDAAGKFSTPGGSAQLQPIDNGVSTVVVQDGPAFSLAFNANQDVSCGFFGEPDKYHHLLLLKAPASFRTDQLAGSWQMVSADCPAQLVPLFSTNNELRAVGGINYEPIGLTWPRARSGSMSIDANGSFIVNMGEVATGTVTAGSSGLVTIQINQEKPFQFNGYINSNLDLIAAANLSTPDKTNQLEYNVLVKTASPTLAEAAGVWNVTSFQFPKGISTNFIFDGNFNAQSYSVVAGYDGTLVVRNPEGTVRASWAPNATGLEIQTGDGTMQGLVTASKSALIINEGYRLNVAVKAPRVSAGKVDAGLSVVGMNLIWAPSTTNCVLQSSPNITGPWTDVPSTQGSNSFTLQNRASVEFFRVKQ